MALPEDFHAIVSQAKGGDRVAMDRLIAVVRPHIQHLARRYADPLHAEESASDLVQEASLRAWQKIDQFQGGLDGAEALAKFRVWMGQIVHRLGLNARRDRQAQKRSPAGRRVLPLNPGDGATTGRGGAGIAAAASGPSPSVRVQRSEEATRVHAALEKIAARSDREVVRLRIFEGLTVEETAKRVGLTVDQVRGRFQACLKVLERELGGPG